MQCGGDRQRTKEFNIVIHEPFFKSIPLSQVIICLFVCHIVIISQLEGLSFGASHYFGNILKLYILMEDGCHILDRHAGYSLW